jgi:hypothetical protein
MCVGLPERLLRWRKFDYLPGTECVAVQGHGHDQPRILRMGVQPRKELERAQKSKHPVLNEWKSCKEGAIVACLVKYYQVRYAMVVLLDKPVDESVTTPTTPTSVSQTPHSLQKSTSVLAPYSPDVDHMVKGSLGRLRPRFPFLLLLSLMSLMVRAIVT